KGRLLPCIGTPEQEDDAAALVVHCADDGIGESLPLPALVRRSTRLFHRQHAVPEENTLPRPMLQEAMNGRRDAEIALQILVDVDVRRGDPHTGLDGGAEDMGLAKAMMRVLPKDHDLDLVERGQVEGPEIVPSLGEDTLSRFLLAQ